jgi:hypothetical protein
MHKIICRNFTLKLERNNADGTKSPLDMSSLKKEEQTNMHLATHDVFDLLVSKDDCREAKAVIKYLQTM